MPNNRVRTKGRRIQTIQVNQFVYRDLDQPVTNEDGTPKLDKDGKQVTEKRRAKVPNPKWHPGAVKHIHHKIPG
jgi:hypothetical protein